MFKRLFSKKNTKKLVKPTLTLEEKNKNEVIKFTLKIERTTLKIENIETEIRNLFMQAKQCKKENKKDKAMRILVQIKSLKKKIDKLNHYNVLMTQRISQMTDITIDCEMGQIFKENVHLLYLLRFLKKLRDSKTFFKYLPFRVRFGKYCKSNDVYPNQ